MNIEQLNAKYALNDELTFVEGKSDFPFIQIKNQFATAMVSVYGGQVLLYQPLNAPHDLLFLSEKAYYKTGKEIKGGVPICWPWFGPDPEDKDRPSHGFARSRMWSVCSTEQTEAGETILTLELVDTKETREIWPYAFKLSLKITVGRSLRLALTTKNTGDQAFNITQALHTYFAIGDIAQTEIIGLAGKQYIDKVDAYKTKSQSGDIAISAEVDRIYLDVPADLSIQDQAQDRRIDIASSGNTTVVVWNPWTEIAASMDDLQDGDYRRFVCVETTNAADNVIELPAGTEFSLLVKYSVTF